MERATIGVVDGASGEAVVERFEVRGSRYVAVRFPRCAVVRIAECDGFELRLPADDARKLLALMSEAVSP